MSVAFSPGLSTVLVVYFVVARDSHGKTVSFAELGNPRSEAGKARGLKRVEESQKGKEPEEEPPDCICPHL